MYIDGIIEAAAMRLTFDDVSDDREGKQEHHRKIRARLNNGNGDHLDVDSDLDRSLN